MVVANKAGVWGGTCTCPDGQQYQVGDNGNFCGSLACTGGVSGACHKNDKGPWAANRQKVTCATAPPASLALTVRSSGESDYVYGAPSVGAPDASGGAVPLFFGGAEGASAAPWPMAPPRGATAPPLAAALAEERDALKSQLADFHERLSVLPEFYVQQAQSAEWLSG